MFGFTSTPPPLKATSSLFLGVRMGRRSRNDKFSVGLLRAPCPLAFSESITSSCSACYVFSTFSVFGISFEVSAIYGLLVRLRLSNVLVIIPSVSKMEIMKVVRRYVCISLLKFGNGAMFNGYDLSEGEKRESKEQS